MSCQVYLLAYTPQPDEIVAAAARICYSNVTAADLLKREEANVSSCLLDDLWRSGHHSPFEHVSFTLGIEGLSRVTSHQLVRHRVASYSQQSQRYVKMDHSSTVVPPSVERNGEAKKIFEEQAARSLAAYNEMLQLGIPAEDARFILPHGCETRLVMTMNARELHHFYALRLCRRAQWEIRELARLMLIETRKVAPLIFKVAGPSCVGTGQCTESRPCGRPYQTMEELLAADN